MNFDEWAKEYFGKFPASEDTRAAYRAAKAAYFAANSETLRGVEVSVDMSECDDTAHHRVFAELTGEFEGGVLLANVISTNY